MDHGVLILARQVHGENGFSVVGSPRHLAPMSPRNLAHDIQSKAESCPTVIAVTLSKSAFKRIKDLVQDLFLNGRPTVLYLNGNVGLVARKHHSNRRVCRSVIDRIPDQIAK